MSRHDSRPTVSQERGARRGQGWGYVAAGLLAVMLAVAGCGKGPTPADTGQDELAEAIREKWGKSYDELPAEKLVLISPHNNDIKYEFEHAFSWHRALTQGKRVEFEWRDVGGGSSAILRYLRNVYERAETAGIDLVFGGGEYPFQFLAREKLLEPLELNEEVPANIPERLGGMPLYDEDLLWCGNVVSGFGFIYNVDLMNKLKLPEPASWGDLGADAYHKRLMLADPTQSGSVAAAYEMIVQSQEDWPRGWALLMKVLSNAKKFSDSSGTAADAPMRGEAVAAICIDFYGSMRVADAPDVLSYVSPAGQTGYTPDPIGILKNPPHEALAQAFVNFVLSLEGQALWALPTSHENGPMESQLNRTPIRKDFYEKYGEALPRWIQNPYVVGAEMDIDAEMREVRYGVLSKLVRSAAIENHGLMLEAREALMERQEEGAWEALFELPNNVATEEDIRKVAELLKDDKEADRITTGWTQYFRSLYQQIK